LKPFQPIGGLEVRAGAGGPSPVCDTEKPGESTPIGTFNVVATSVEGPAQFEITPTRIAETNKTITKPAVKRRLEGLTTLDGSGGGYFGASAANLTLRGGGAVKRR
jgi:hypothetical protein